MFSFCPELTPEDCTWFAIVLFLWAHLTAEVCVPVSLWDDPWFLFQGRLVKGKGGGLCACFFMGWAVVLVFRIAWWRRWAGFVCLFLCNWVVVLVSGPPGEGDGRGHGPGVQSQNQGHCHHGAPGQGQSSLQSYHTYPTQVVSRLFWLVVMFL